MEHGTHLLKRFAIALANSGLHSITLQPDPQAEWTFW